MSINQLWIFVEKKVSEVVDDFYFDVKKNKSCHSRSDFQF